MALKLLTPVRFGKREKIYLCCHPEDLEVYSKEMLDLLCSYHDFDIYCFDTYKPFDEEYALSLVG